jgi:hypothetical protein
LNYCDVIKFPCFDGAIATNSAGQIDQWNLVADGAPGQPYLTFITYNNPWIGTVDALGSMRDGQDEFSENQLRGETGSWNGFTASSYSVPEASTWAMLALGFAALGFAGYRRCPLSVPRTELSPPQSPAAVAEGRSASLCGGATSPTLPAKSIVLRTKRAGVPRKTPASFPSPRRRGD